MKVHSPNLVRLVSNRLILVFAYTLPLIFMLLANPAHALFCTKGYKNIVPGMTQDQVLAACGPPITKEESTKPLQRRVEVTQLTYNNAGAPAAIQSGLTPRSPYYGIWGNPVDIRGDMVQVDIVDNMIYAISMDGTTQNGFSTCKGVKLEIGDPASKVYAACGPPLLKNQTFILENIMGSPKPELWTYQMTKFEPIVSLTFVNGTLQSIE